MIEFILLMNRIKKDSISNNLQDEKFHEEIDKLLYKWSSYA